MALRTAWERGGRCYALRVVPRPRFRGPTFMGLPGRGGEQGREKTVMAFQAGQARRAGKREDIYNEEYRLLPRPGTTSLMMQSQLHCALRVCQADSEQVLHLDLLWSICSEEVCD